MSPYPGLAAIAAAWGRVSGENIDAEGVAYRIRQIHTTVGCQHACTHCFAAPPRARRVMPLAGFARLSGEMGAVARRAGRGFEFVFLGSATDPSSIPEFASYLERWIAAVGDTTFTRLYTHGWILSEPAQRGELAATCAVLAANHTRVEKVNVSVDLFSALARRSIEAYASNVAANLLALRDAVGEEGVRLHVMYPLGRREHATVWNQPDGEPAGIHSGDATTRLTGVLFAIGEAAGWNRARTAAACRDAGIPIEAGRARRLYAAGGDDSTRQLALGYFRRKALPRLGNDTVGLHVHPGGRVQVVDYDGYDPGLWLDNGEAVVAYLGEFGTVEGR